MPIINQIVKGSGGSAPAYYIERKVDANGVLSPQGVTTPIDLTGVTKLSDGALSYAYYNNASLTQLPDLSHIIEINNYALQYAFYQCTGITTGELDLSSLQTVNGFYALQYSFTKCNLTGINLKNLQSFGNSSSGIVSYCFADNNISTIQFQSLHTIWSSYGGGSYTFARNPLQDIWFYALTNARDNNAWSQFLRDVSNCTVHFPMALQNTMSSWTNVTNGFGGTNTTVLFDLVQTLTGADSNTYTRQEKDSTSTATAWVYNDTLYYTSGVSNHTGGVNEPQIGDTIYSDAACTTAVTTISAIA